MSSTSTQNLLQIVSRSIDVLGEEETVNVLRRATSTVDKNSQIDFVIDMVCGRLNYSPDQLTSRTRNNKRLLAIHFICYYCYVLGNVSYKDLGIRIKRTRPLVHGYIKDMEDKKLNSKEPYYKEHFIEFDKQIKKYQKTKKVHHTKK